MACVNLLDGSAVHLHRVVIFGVSLILQGGDLLVLQMTRRVALSLAIFLITFDVTTFCLCLLEGGAGIREGSSYLWFLGLLGK